MGVVERDLKVAGSHRGIFDLCTINFPLFPNQRWSLVGFWVCEHFFKNSQFRSKSRSGQQTLFCDLIGIWLVWKIFLFFRKKSNSIFQKMNLFSVLKSSMLMGDSHHPSACAVPLTSLGMVDGQRKMIGHFS